jgi:ATP-dependent Clp protease ATP-binding subunit ClpX
MEPNENEPKKQAPWAPPKPEFPAPHPERFAAPLLPTPNEIIAMLDKKVVGQIEAKRTLAVAAYSHFLNCALGEISNHPVEPTSVLLVGPTGSGKSFLLKSLRECLMKIPMVYVSCTNLTQNGYKGVNVNEILDRLENELLEDNRTQPAIVVWDEVDKLRELPSTHPVITCGVQQDLLTYLDGTLCGKSGLLDSSRILNVACGAFVGLDKLRKRQNSAPRIGFVDSLHAAAHAESEETVEPLSTRHLIDYGFIPEFVGRFGAITELTRLDAVTLRKILTEAEGNPLAVKKRMYEIHGIDLRITDCALDELIARAEKMETGARSLKRVIHATLGRYDRRLPEMAARGVTTLTVTAETIRGEKPAIQTTAIVPKDLSLLLELRKRAGAYTVWTKKPKEESVW